MNKTNWVAVVAIVIVIVVLVAGAGMMGTWGYGGWGMMGPWMMSPWMMGGMFLVWLIPIGLLILIGLGIAWLVQSLGQGNPPAQTSTCPSCGRAVRSDWKNCPYCGSALSR